MQFCINKSHLAHGMRFIIGFESRIYVVWLFFWEFFYINIYQGHWAGCNFSCSIFVSTSGKCCLHKMILEVFLFLQFSRTVWGLVLILFKHLVEFPVKPSGPGPFLCWDVLISLLCFYGGMFITYSISIVIDLFRFLFLLIQFCKLYVSRNLAISARPFNYLYMGALCI